VDPPPQFVRALRELVRRLASGETGETDARGSLEREGAAALRQALESHELQLVPLPDEAVERARWYPQGEHVWQVWVPLWTPAGDSGLLLHAQFSDRKGDVRFRWHHLTISPPYEPGEPTEIPAPPEVQAALRDVARRLAAREFDGLVDDGHYTRGGPADLEEMVDDYPAPLVEPPEDAFADAEMTPLDEAPGWAVDVDLWTREGRSDLSLIAYVRERDGNVHVEIRSIHVM